MIRIVDLLSHLPQFICEFFQIQSIMKAEEPEIQKMEDDSEIVKDNMFVTSTNEDGIKRFEKMFGIVPSSNDTLETRRARVMARYTTTATYTMHGLIERLNAICGVDNYTIEFIPNEYRIKIVFSLRVKDLMKTIESMMYEMIPANMICECTLQYNTHETLSKYPQYILEQLTHKELSDSIIDDLISSSCDNLSNYTMGDLKSISCENISTYGMRKV